MNARTAFRTTTVGLAALWLVVASTGLASAADELCEQPLAPDPAFTRSALEDLVHEDFAVGRLDAVAAKLSAAYEASLTSAERTRPEVDIFLLRLKSAAHSVPQQWTLQRLQKPAGAEALFSADDAGRRVVFDCMALASRDEKPAAWQHNMVSIAFVMQKVLLPTWNEADRKRFDLISTRLKNHEDLLKNGMPMWPWELWLNGKRLGANDTDPLPVTQIVFMRPSVGLEINTRSRAKADLEGSLLIEPIGVIRYLDPEYSRWVGVSAVVTSSTRQGMGYGFVVRYGRYAAGLTRHKSDTGGGDDTYLALSFDLYDLIEKKRETYPADRARLKKSVRELLEQLP
jgi:hypothetical protein